MSDKKPKGSAVSKRAKRIRHVLWSGLIVLICMPFIMFQPLDQLIWTAQSRLNPTEASGNIVFIGADEDLASPQYPERRVKLAQLIERLADAGAESVYLDKPFETPSTPEIDDRLNRALRQFDGEAYLVRPLLTNLNGVDEWARTAPSVANGIHEVAGVVEKGYMGFAWYSEYQVERNGVTLPHIATSIAGVRPIAGEIFPISYHVKRESIPALSFDEATAPSAQLGKFKGKTIVIGDSRRLGGLTYSVPGYTDVNRTLIHIYAAETLAADGIYLIPGTYVIAVFFLLLLGTGCIASRRTRHIAYAFLVSAILVGIYVSALFTARFSAADAIALLAIFGIFRWRHAMADTVRLTDGETGLPTFAALEVDKDLADSLPAIIVARIHKFEDVRRSLPRELHGEYVLRITQRLKAATQDATIYLGQGHMIAWAMPEKDTALIREHLAGLRALFSSPLIVGDQQVDVGITFGVDVSPSPNVARRLASAIAVAEQTNETYDPIAIAETASEEDLIWNISLQARIDAALSNGEIYLVYQPKMMVQTGEILGVEVLVRWNDPQRGHIPPDAFIRQCETAGRMNHLTRYVLKEACQAGKLLEQEGVNLPIAVNVSATMVHERGIVDMVADVLASTGYSPSKLTLEVTETYRISNIELACEILEALAQLGVKISMDDFGVGVASLEALLHLPFTELKIDRLFVSRMTSDEKALSIVSNILQMGKDMRIIVVAEGVEDGETLTLLRNSGCLVAQGYAISRPVELETIFEIQRDSKGSQLISMV